MKNKKWLAAAMMTLALAAMFSGCAQPPEAEKSAAKTAMDAAVSAEAPRYARADYNAAMALWDASEAQVREKKYQEAKQSYIAAKGAFEKAAGAVAVGKKAVVGEVSADEMNDAVASLEADWGKLQTLARKVEKKLEKKKLWEADAQTFRAGLKATRELIATDPISAKLKFNALRPFIDSYTMIFKQLEAVPEKSPPSRDE